MLNSVVLMGRLVADPILTVAASGKEICRFKIAVERNGGDRIADFIPIICFDSSARFVEKYFRKGSMISVQGKLQTGSYTDKGVKKYTFEVKADELGFCGGKREDAGKPSPSDLRSANSPKGRGKEDEGVNGYYSTAVPSDFDEIVGDEDYE